MKKRVSLALGLISLIAFGGLVLAGAVFCAATLHVPRRLTPAPSNAAEVAIISQDRARLVASWFQPDSRNGNCVLVLHGIADSRASAAGFAPMFLRENYSVLTPDSRAHGASGGEFVTYGLLEKYDVLSWAAWMRAQGCRSLYGLGESLGGSILIQAAAVKPEFRAIVAECPYADLREIAVYRTAKMAPHFVAKLVVASAMRYAALADHLNLADVSPVRDIARTATPIFLIHGLADSRTPPSHSRRLAAANPLTKLWLVPNADHTAASSTEPDEFRRQVLSWFATH